MVSPRVLKIALPITFILVAIVLSVVMLQTRPQAMVQPVEQPSLLVTVNTARRQPVTFVVHSQGTVTPRTQTTLVSEVAGQIIEVSLSFVSGGFFAKGDGLLRIDPRNYESALKRAQADVAKAQTQVATESALAGYALDDWKKLRDLNIGDDEKPSDLALRKPQMQEALAELTSKEAELERTQEDLNRTVIRAPYGGMVREKLADVGQYVNTGAQVARTFAIDRAEVRLPITQQDLKYLDLKSLRNGGTLEAKMTADIGGETFAWDASIVRSEGVFNEATRIVHVVASIDDPYRLQSGDGEPLRMGTFVAAEIQGLDGGELFTVPRHALTRGTTMWVVGDESRIYPHEVDIVRTDEKHAYLSGGIDEGDRYVTIPVDQPLPGMTVRFSE